MSSSNLTTNKKTSGKHPYSPVFRCKQKQYNSVLWSLQFLYPLLLRRGAAAHVDDDRSDATIGSSDLDNSDDTLLPTWELLGKVLQGAPCSLNHAGPLTMRHMRALSDPRWHDVIVQHFATQFLTTLVSNSGCGCDCESLYPAPSSAMQRLWNDSIISRYVLMLRDNRAEKIQYYSELSREGYLCESGLHALLTFTQGPGVAGTAAAAAWASVMDPYTLSLPDRSHIHELENLPQEVGIGELLRDAVEDIKRLEPDYALSCLVDVGGGNGFLAAEVGERLECDSIVIDPYFPTHSVDCLPRCWADTTDRVRPARTRRFLTHRRVAFFRDVDWDRDIGEAHHPDRTAMVAKHLCGTAVDECLRHLDAMGRLPRLLVLAPCCFNKGVYNEYINPQFLTDILDVKSEDAFDHMTRLTDWNLSVYQKNAEGGGRASQKSIHHLVAVTETLSKTIEALMNYGRLLWLRDRGYAVRLVEYVPDCVTPKNKCIVAYRRKDC